MLVFGFDKVHFIKLIVWIWKASMFDIFFASTLWELPPDIKQAINLASNICND